MVKAIIDKIKADVIDCSNKDLTIDLDGQSIAFKPEIKLNQLDGKILIEITGLRGAFCLLCFVTRKDANDPFIIRNGFVLNRTNDEMLSLYEFFGDDLLSVKSEERSGMTGKPMITGNEISVYNNIPVLHGWINSLRLFEELAFFFNARTAFPDEVPVRGAGRTKTPAQSLAHKQAKAEFQHQSKHGPLNVALASPSSTGAGGTTDTGNRSSQSVAFNRCQKMGLKVLSMPTFDHY